VVNHLLVKLATAGRMGPRTTPPAEMGLEQRARGSMEPTPLHKSAARYAHWLEGLEALWKAHSPEIPRCHGQYAAHAPSLLYSRQGFPGKSWMRS